MPDATTAGERPQDVLRAWGEAFAAKDLDRMMELYEPSSVWVSDRGDMISGLAGIREVFEGFLALDAAYEAEDPTVVEADGVALLQSRWTVRGPEVNLSGRTADVLRRQPDGTWVYVIDSPFGGSEVPAA